VRKTIVTVLIHALVAGIVLELCARLDDWFEYRAPLLAPYAVEGLYEVKEGVQRGKAHARYQNWQLNSLGLRGPELSPGSRRVLCIGASETLGMLETPGSEFPRQLERTLRELHPQPPIDVANLSYFGLTLATANKLLPSVMQAVAPEVVVIYPTYGGYVARQSFEAPADAPLRSSAPLLRLQEKLSDVLKAQLPAGVMTALRKREIHDYLDGRTAIERMPADRPAYLRHDLEQLVASIRAHGAQPILVTHATRFNGNQDPEDRAYFLTSWRKFYPLFSEQALLHMEDELNQTVRQVAAEQGIALVDAATRLPGGGQYFTDHEHFTDHGAGALAAMIAQATAAELERNGSSVARHDTPRAYD
jgi:hypothetical protein